MKNKKILRIAAVLASLSMIGTMNVSATKVISDDYQTMSESFDKTFNELLNMSDEEFCSLDKYCGNSDEETITFRAGHGFISNIISTTANIYHKDELEKIIGHEIDVTEEGTEKAWEEYCDIHANYNGSVFNAPARIADDQYIKSLGPYYGNAAKTDIANDLIVGYTDMTPVFIMQDVDLSKIITGDQDEPVLRKIDKNELAKQLKHYFGDTVKYHCYSLNNWNGDELGVKIVFDTLDKLENNEKNQIYNAKLLCCLSNICNTVYMEKAQFSPYESAQKDIMSGKYEVISNDTVIDEAVLGDANNDNTLNVRDCSVIANALANGKGAELPDSADYNKDGNKNVRDAAEIARELASAK